METLFVEVILPLALPGTLTYRVPAVLAEETTPGKRAIVQLGRNKLYTALIKKVHQHPPTGYQAKYIDSILDDEPVVLESQFKLWDWIAEYYCCTQGEVMNAALPGGLKLSSETRFTLLGDTPVASDLSEHEHRIILTLQDEGSMTMQELTRVVEQSAIRRTLKSLLDRKIIASEEELRETYKPKTTAFVRLSDAYRDENALNELFQLLEKKRSTKQSDAVMMFLRLSGFDSGKSGEVRKKELLEQAGVSSQVLQSLIEKGVFDLVEKETGRLPGGLISTEKPYVLSTSQFSALREIEKSWSDKQVCLLHGITSSGKTEVYAQLIQEHLNHGQQVLFLLPEIALTTQLIQRLRRFFGNHLGVYHSGYSDNQRTEVWNKVLSGTPGECDVIVGARSALFLPFKRLGLVIVDEEHEHSYKQHDPAPRYHARDTAIVLAKNAQARVLLGSATPSLESYWNATQQRYGLVEMNERYGGIEPPEMVIADLRKELKSRTMKGVFSSILIANIEEALAKDEQVILFQNRRGYAPLWQCRSCGWVPMCNRCDVSLTYHKHNHRLICHYCGYAADPPSHCETCGSHDIRMVGFGTEKIEEELRELFPEVRSARMDLDTTRSRSAYQKLLTDFESGEIRILVGTQMITKGLDFDRVALVGILNADAMMKFPDFRSIERSFQLMVQVAGRAGRRASRGKVIIQTYEPDHWLMDMVVQSDYKRFYDHEIRERYHFGYPPYTRMIRMTVKHRDERIADALSQELAEEMYKLIGNRFLGPETPYVSRINNFYLRQFILKLVKGPELTEIKNNLRALISRVTARDAYRSARIVLDVEPF